MAGSKKSPRKTNRGTVFSDDELEFLDDKGQIIDCDYQFAVVRLKETLSGKVLPKELTGLLTDYVNNPCLETALDLILFDSHFLLYFYDNESTKQLRVGTTWESQNSKPLREE